MIDVSVVTDVNPLVFTAEEVIGVPAGFGVITENAGVSFSGRIIRKGAKYLLEGRLSAALAAECALCLRETSIRIDFDVSEVFSRDHDSDILEEWPVENGQIDLQQVLKSNLLMAIPSKILCKEDCRGLCRICGKDLNDGLCGCSADKTDDRFDSLKDYDWDKK